MALTGATALCRDDAADPRLLGRRSVGGKQQFEQKFRLEELAHEGRKAAGSGKVEEAVQAGWATLLQTVKVRQSKSKDSKVVGFVEEGRRVRISKVCSKSAQLEEPLVGWVTLSKGGAVLRQEESSATMWAVANVMARYGAKTEPTPGAVPTLQSLVSATSGSSADVAEVVLETDAAVAVTVQAVETPASEAWDKRKELNTTAFHLLPSVATWLSAAGAPQTGLRAQVAQAEHSTRRATSNTDMPPASSVDPMEDQAVVEPKAEAQEIIDQVAVTPFRQLPSVGTWLSAFTPPHIKEVQLGRQGDQVVSLAENEMLRPLVQQRAPSAIPQSSESESFWVTLHRALREMCCVGR